MTLRPWRIFQILGLAGFLLCRSTTAPAHHSAQHSPEALRQVSFEQRLGETLPLHLTFRDASGHVVRLGEYFGTTPVILTLAYHRCENLCPLVLNGLVQTLRTLSFSVGEQFQIITLSIDPRDTADLAAARKAHYIREYSRPGAAQGWHFLTGEPEAIQHLAQAAGFRYTYDAASEQFAHASGLVILTPQGVVARYVFGLEFAPRDVRLGLVEAAAQKIGSPIDQLLLLCYHYDPRNGTYSLVILNTLRLAGGATVVTLGTLLGVMWRRERARQPTIHV
ncbi:MAG: SCO family protein [Candidatus Tectimicrobiota bacterium]